MGVPSSNCHQCSLLVACALALLACDDARSTATTPEEISPTEREAQPAPTPGEQAKEEAGPEAETAPVEAEAPPPPGPSCDQRERTKTCVDYGAKRGTAAPRCVEGVELGEHGCAREDVAARCTLPATGVVIYSYEGRPSEAVARECETIDGELDLTSAD